MTSWSAAVLLVLAGVAAGPYGLNVVSPSFLVLIDPVVAMALAMVGVFIGLAIDVRRPRPSWPAVLVLIGIIAIIVFRNSGDPVPVVAALTIAAVSVAIAFAGWLLVGKADSEREQQGFVIGCLLLLGGSAAYASLSAVFAGLLAGIAWNSAGDLARARIVTHLDYLQHPLIVVMLLVAGASIRFSVEALALAVIVTAIHATGRSIADPFPVPAGAAAIAVALDVFRGVPK